MKLVFPAKLDFLSRFTWSIIITIIIVLVVTIILTVISWAIFIINVIVMNMTIMVILKTISRLLYMTSIRVTLNDLSEDLGESPQNKIITIMKK